MLDSTNVRGRNNLEVGFFWDKSANKTDGIFDGPFFPRVISIAEERLRVKRVIDVGMEIIFQAIVVGDGAVSKGRMIEESRNDGGSDGSGIISRDFRNFDKTGLTFE